MPIPQPKPNEDKNKFISRCISELSKIDPDKPAKQIQAICYNTWNQSQQQEISLTNPDKKDVHIPKASKKVSQKVKQITNYSIEAVPIFKAGVWKDKLYTIEDLDEIVRNTNALIKANIHEPPAKLGHSDEQELLKMQGLPAAGYVSRVYRIGDEIFADFVNIPKEILDMITERRYDKVSSEIYLEFKHPSTQENIGKVLRAVAFLGADIPEVKGLGNIMYHTDKNKYEVVSFEDKNLEEANIMSNKWYLHQIKDMVPCCYEEIEKYFSENKLEYISGDKLAELLATIKVKRLLEQDTTGELKNYVKHQDEQEQPECPEGYIWDPDKGQCIPNKDTKEEKQERIICPKGFKWDETQNKCVPIEEKIDTETNKQTEEKNYALKIAIPLLNLLGYDIDPEKPLHEQITDEDVQSIIDEINSWDEYKEINPKNLTKEKIEEYKQKMKEANWQGFPDDKRPPKGWFDKCVKSVSEVSDNPEALCGWIWYYHMKPETKARVEATRQIEKQSENPEVIELKNKIKQYENEKLKEYIEKLKLENRGVFLPVFDKYIETIYNTISQTNDIVKFEDKEITIRDLFINFIKEIIKSKQVIFTELMKTENKETVDTEKYRSTILEKYTELKPNMELGNVELSALAEHISQKEGLSYKDALLKAYKLINKGEKI